MNTKKFFAGLLFVLVVCSIALSMAPFLPQQAHAGWLCGPPRSCDMHQTDPDFAYSNVEDCCCQFSDPDHLFCW